MFCLRSYWINDRSLTLSRPGYILALRWPVAPPPLSPPRPDRDVNLLVNTGEILQKLDTDVHSAVTAMVRIVMLQRWQWQRWDISGYDTVVTAMFTLVWQRCQLPLLSQ